MADLVLYDMTQLSMLPKTDPIGALVYGTHANVIQTVWINGLKILDNYKLLMINEETIRQKLSEKSEWLINDNSKIGYLRKTIEDKYDRALQIGPETGKKAYPALTTSWVNDSIRNITNGRNDQSDNSDSFFNIFAGLLNNVHL